MYERRRQAASLVSSLVVTSVFVWACSSGGHEDDSVTTSGGAGSEVTAGRGAATSDTEGGFTNGAGGVIDSGSASSMNEAGSHDGKPAQSEPDPSTDDPEIGDGGASSAGGAPHSMGGTLGIGGTTSAAGTPSAGTPSAGTPSAGTTSVAGAPAVAEPVCDPADDTSTLDMALPCDVYTALYVCRHCHGKPPISSVPTSYVTYADIKPKAAQIYGVIKSGTMPWPPYTLSAWQKSTVLKWLGKNGSCAIGAAKSCE